jgi:hypothetical protein
MRNINRHFLLWALLLLNISAKAQTTVTDNPFEKIDAHARACPRHEARTVESLATYLGQGTSNDLEKARAIFVWLTRFISYDAAGLNGNLGLQYTAKEVLRDRSAICEGFSNLYLELGKAMHLDIRKVVGYSKGISYTPGKRFKEPNHAWNTIKIDGKWHLFDATWGEGSSNDTNGALSSKKEFESFWFDVDPYAAIFSHMPEDTAFAFVQPAINLAKFENMPDINHEYFKMGFDAADTYRSISQNNNLKFPETYAYSGAVKFVTAPKYAQLKVGETYQFECKTPGAVKMAVLDARDQWTFFEPENGVFKLNYKPRVTGELIVLVQFSAKDPDFSTVLSYQVKAAKP